MVGHLLSRLHGVKATGPGRWIARCPSHEDRVPSLSVRELEDGRVLLHCFAGCSVSDIVATVGLDLSDLFPPRPITHARPERHQAFPADLFDIIRRKAVVVWLIGRDMHAGKSISDRDYEHLGDTVTTLERIAEAAYE